MDKLSYALGLSMGNNFQGIGDRNLDGRGFYTWCASCF